MNPSAKKEFLIPFVLGFSAIVSIITLTMLSPALPAMENYFHTNATTMQNLLSMNMFVTAFCVLIFGSLIHSVDRVRLYLIGIGLLGVSACGSALSTHIVWLFVFQVFQSIGISACSVFPLFFVKELYPGVRGTKIMSVWGIVLPIAPSLSGFFGGVLTEYASWQSIFVVLGIAAAILWVGVKVSIPETKSLSERAPLCLKSHLSDYLTLLKNDKFLKIVLLPGLGFAGLSAYTATAPFVFIQSGGLSPRDYGLYLFVTFFGMVCGSLFVRALVHRWTLQKFLKPSVSIMIAGGIFFLSGALYQSQDPILFSVIMMIYGIGFGALLTSATSLGLDAAGARKGHAAALLRCMQFIFMAGGIFIAGALYQGNFLNPAFLILGFSCLCGLTLWRASL